MSVRLLDEIDVRTRELTTVEQLELARRLLNRIAALPAATNKQYLMADLIGAGKGTWKTAAVVDTDLREERGSWG